MFRNLLAGTYQRSCIRFNEGKEQQIQNRQKPRTRKAQRKCRVLRRRSSPIFPPAHLSFVLRSWLSFQTSTGLSLFPFLIAHLPRCASLLYRSRLVPIRRCLSPPTAMTRCLTYLPVRSCSFISRFCSFLLSMSHVFMSSLHMSCRTAWCALTRLIPYFFTQLSSFLLSLFPLTFPTSFSLLFLNFYGSISSPRISLRVASLPRPSRLIRLPLTLRSFSFLGTLTLDSSLSIT